MAAAIRSVGQLRPNRTALFLCDMQEKFANSITHFPEIVATSARLLKAGRILQIPIFVTEQYPKGLGRTVAELGDISDLKVYEKNKFSMCLPELMANLPQQVDSVLLCGIESHVCVQQTSLDLIEKHYQVHVVADAVSSRNPVDRSFALKRMRAAGCWITTSESAILSLAGGSDHPNFKELQKIIWEPAPDSGLLQPGGREGSKM